MPNPVEPDVLAGRDAGLKSDVRGSGLPSKATGNPAEGPREKAPDAAISELGDAWLVERAKHGDQKAFAVLVRRYERKLIRVLVRMVRDPELARDLGQETFFRVYSRLGQFDSARRFGPWLFRVGVNLSLDWLRSRKSEFPPTMSLDSRRRNGQPVFELSDDDPRIQADLVQEVQYVLERMPVAHRTILVLRDLEGFSSSEVAAIVGRREATVRWRLSKARDKFRELWQRRQEGERGEIRVDEGEWS